MFLQLQIMCVILNVLMVDISRHCQRMLMWETGCSYQNILLSIYELELSFSNQNVGKIYFFDYIWKILHNFYLQFIMYTSMWIITRISYGKPCLVNFIWINVPVFVKWDRLFDLEIFGWVIYWSSLKNIRSLVSTLM